MSINNFEGIAIIMQEDCNNLNVLLSDIEIYFEDKTDCNPTKSAIDSIKYDFARIRSYLLLAFDVVNKIDRAAKEIETQVTREIREGRERNG